VGRADEHETETPTAEAAGNLAFTRLLRDAGAVPPDELDGAVSQGAGPLNRATGAAIASARGGGTPLPDGLRAEMQHHLNLDLSGVRLHTGQQASTLTTAVQAEAFTTGSDIFFSAGRYDPGTPAGKELLAHELTHVAQQAGGGVSIQHADGEVSHPDDAAEVEARSVARRIIDSPALLAGAAAGLPSSATALLAAPAAPATPVAAGPVEAAPVEAAPVEEAAAEAARVEVATGGPATVSRLETSTVTVDTSDPMPEEEPAAPVAEPLRDQQSGGDAPPAGGADGAGGSGGEGGSGGGAGSGAGSGSAGGPPGSGAESGASPVGGLFAELGELFSAAGDAIMSGFAGLFGSSTPAPGAAAPATTGGPAPDPAGPQGPNGGPVPTPQPAPVGDAEVAGSGPTGRPATSGTPAPGGASPTARPATGSGPVPTPAPVGDAEVAGAGPGGDRPAAGGPIPKEPPGAVGDAEVAGAGRVGTGAGGGAGGAAPTPAPGVDAVTGASAVMPGAPSPEAGGDPRQVLAPRPPRPAPPLTPHHPDPGVQHWKQDTHAHIHGIHPADTAHLKAAPGQVTAKAADVQAKRVAAKQDYVAQNKKAVPDKPVTEAPPPTPAPDPVPAATTVMAAAAALRLPSQTPAARFDRSPTVHDEAAHVHVDGLMPGEVAPPAPAATVALPGGVPGPAAQTDPAMGKAKTESGKAVVPEERSAAPPGPVALTDPGPRAEPDVPPQVEQDLTGALGKVLANAPQLSDELVRFALENAFPDKMLPRFAPHLADGVGQQVQTELTGELYGIGAEAGIADADLKQTVADYRAQAAVDAAAADGLVVASSTQAHGATEKQARAEQARVTGTAAATDEQIALAKEAATGQADPAYTEAKAKSLRERVYTDAATVRANQRLALERRRGELQSWAAKQASLSDTTATAQLRRIKDAYAHSTPVAGESADAHTAHVAQLSAPTLTWSRRNAVTAADTAAELTRQADRFAAEAERQVATMEAQAVELVENWRDTRLGQERNWWRRLMDQISDWGSKATAANRAWEQVRNREVVAHAVEDAALIEKFQQAAHEGNKDELRHLMSTLDAAQRTVLAAFLNGGTAIDQLAEGVVTRLRMRRIPELISRFESAAEQITDWTVLEQLGRAQNPTFDAQHIAEGAFDALDRTFNHNAEAFTLLKGLTPIQLAAVRACYLAADHKKRTLDDKIGANAEDEELDRGKALMAGDQVGAEAAELAGSTSGHADGGFETTVLRVLRGKSPEQMRTFKAKFEAMYHVSVETWIGKHGSDTLQQRARLLLTGDVAGADAVGTKEALTPDIYYDPEGGSYDMSPGPKAAEAIANTRGAEADAYAGRIGATSAETADLRRQRLAELGVRYGTDYGGGDTALTDAARARGGDRLAAVMAGDDAGRDAADLRSEEDSLIYVSDAKVNDIMERARTRARDDAKRDIAAQDAVERRTESKEDVERLAKTRRARMEAAARTGTASNLDTLKDRYHKLSGDRDHNTVESVVEDHTSGHGKDEATDRLNQGGWLEVDQDVHYAVVGAGTDESRLTKTLHDPYDQSKLRSKDELRTARAGYRARYDGDELEDDVRGDVSGRLAHDTDDALLGEAETAEERLARRQADLDYETGDGSGIGSLFAGNERRRLDRSKQYMQAAYAKLQKAMQSKDPAAIKLATEEFEARASGVGESIEAHRAAVDSITDTIATVAAAAAGIAVIIASGGTLTPAVAALAAAASGTAGIAVRAAMQGHAYGIEDIALDAGATALDAVTAAATVGLGNALMKGSALARVAGAGKLAGIARTVVTDSAINALGGVPSSIARALADDDIMRSDDPFSRILESAGMAYLIGLGTGVALSSVHVAGSAALKSIRGRFPAAAFGDTPALRAAELVTKAHVEANGHVESGGVRTGTNTAAGEIVTDTPLPELRGNVESGGTRTATETTSGEIRNNTELKDGHVVGQDRIGETRTGGAAPEPRGHVESGGTRTGSEATSGGIVNDTELGARGSAERAGQTKPTSATSGEIRTDAEIPVAQQDRVQVRKETLDPMQDGAGNPAQNPDGSIQGWLVRGNFDAQTVTTGGTQATEITIRLKLNAHAGVTPADIQSVQSRTRAGVDQHYNGGHTLPNGDQLSVKIEFVDSAAQAHQVIELYPGDGDANQRDWFVNNHQTIYAHELGHQMGLLDEYVDVRALNRADPAAPGVHTKTLMGDFWLRDPATGHLMVDPATGQPMVDPEAVIHDRHLQQIAADIEAVRAAAAANRPTQPDLSAVGAGGSAGPGPGTGSGPGTGAGEAAPAPRRTAAPPGGTPAGGTPAPQVQPPATTIARIAALLQERPDLITPRGLRLRYDTLATDARFLLSSYAKGETGTGARIGWPDSPELADQMERLAASVQAARSIDVPDPIVHFLLLEELRVQISEAGEVLRAQERRFAAEVSGDEVPGRARGGQQATAAHEASATIAEHTAAADIDGMSPEEVVAMLHFGDPVASASGRVGEPLDRELPGLGLNRKAPTASDIAKWKTNPPELAAKLAAIFTGWQQAHMIGPGFGGELWEGMMLASSEFNLTAQNSHVETYIRTAHENGFQVERLRVQVEGMRLAVPMADGSFEHLDVLTKVTYEIHQPRVGEAPLRVVLEADPPPGRGWRATTNDIPTGAPGSF
jgi:Domain of unknown function (DUF4157)/Bacterial toxin 4